MGEELQQLLKSPLIVSIISLILGALIASVINKLRNKSGVFGYNIFFYRIGLSTDDAIFGSVRVSWQGHEVRNLYTYTFEVENSTSTDYEHVEFKIYSGNETIILNEKTAVLDSPYIILWSDEFKQGLHVPENTDATEKQLDEYNHRREYYVPVFNRGQILRFTYLCTRPSDDLEPGIYISTPSKSIKLKRRRDPAVLIKPLFGVPIPVATIRAFIIAVVVVILCGLFVESVWIASALSMLVGLIGQIFGALAYRIEKMIKNAIAG